MAKDSKADEATVEVKVSELQAAKDQIITVLMNVQNYIGQLNNAYLAHINSVIAGGPATIDFPTLPAGLSNPLGSADLAVLGRAGSPGADGSKKRKRAPVDPNAPKRALTPYFLYMQHNRAAIAADLPADAKPKEIGEEGTRRWQNMDATEREVWKQMYSKNYEQYKKKLADYKAGRKVEDDGAANQLQQDIAGADNDESDSSSSDEDDESEDESSPSPPQPTPKEKTPAAKKRRSENKTKEVPESATKTAPASQKKPAKGGKKAEKAAESVAATPAESKSKGGRKKRKSEA